MIFRGHGALFGAPGPVECRPSRLAQNTGLKERGVWNVGYSYKGLQGVGWAKLAEATVAVSAQV
jgi:hypothetical protein